MLRIKEVFAKDQTFTSRYSVSHSNIFPKAYISKANVVGMFIIALGHGIDDTSTLS